VGPNSMSKRTARRICRVCWTRAGRSFTSSTRSLQCCASTHDCANQTDEVLLKSISRRLGVFGFGCRSFFGAATRQTLKVRYALHYQLLRAWNKGVTYSFWEIPVCLRASMSSGHPQTIQRQRPCSDRGVIKSREAPDR
jgi:hypothetical protein